MQPSQHCIGRLRATALHLCPKSGKILSPYPRQTSDWPGMSDLGELRELVDYLTRTTRLSSAEAQRVVAEVLSYLQETPEEFVRRRHRALQAEGLSNPSIYMRLAEELSARRFRAPEYTPRQIRRMIYG
jgi:hypothetical protein